MGRRSKVSKPDINCVNDRSALKICALPGNSTCMWNRKVVVVVFVLLLLKPVFFGLIYDVKSHLQSEVLGLILSWETDVRDTTSTVKKKCLVSQQVPDSIFLSKLYVALLNFFPIHSWLRPSNMAHQYAKRSPSTIILTRGSTSYNLYSGCSTNMNQATSAFYDIKSPQICVPRSDFSDVQFLYKQITLDDHPNTRFDVIQSLQRMQHQHQPSNISILWYKIAPDLRSS